MSRSGIFSIVLFFIVWLNDFVGLGRGLARDMSMGDSVGFVNSGADCGSISVLHRLMGGLVGQSQGED